MTSTISHRQRTIYFIRPVDGGPVKIGCSRTPYLRFKFFAEWSPVAMELAAKAPGRMVDEAAIHRAFADLRLHGEWFRPSPRIDALIEQIKLTSVIPAEFLAQPAPVREPRLKKDGTPRKIHKGPNARRISSEEAGRRIRAGLQARSQQIRARKAENVKAFSLVPRQP